jgi:Family of unknown function (DUF5709)
MTDERRRESADLGDYEVRDASDTLDGAPGDDPLDRGVAAPQRWTTAIRYGATAEEQQAGESLDQLLAAENPDVGTEPEADDPDLGWDENATTGDVARFALEDGSDPRAGRLTWTDDGPDVPVSPDLIGYDAGVDGGAASAEEAAVHLVDEDAQSTDEG